MARIAVVSTNPERLQHLGLMMWLGIISHDTLPPPSGCTLGQTTSIPA